MIFVGLNKLVSIYIGLVVPFFVCCLTSICEDNGADLVLHFLGWVKVIVFFVLNWDNVAEN